MPRRKGSKSLSQEPKENTIDMESSGLKQGDIADFYELPKSM